MSTMTPVELLDDHARRPRQLGKLIQASAIGDVGSIMVGDALRFYIAIEADHITQARFQVFNCPTMIATTSMLSEIVVGMSLDEALRVGSRTICERFGGLDPTRLPAQLWGVAALEAAIAAYRGQQVPFHTDRDAQVCRCFGVSEQNVRDAIAAGGLDSVGTISAVTRAGQGCGSCATDLRRLLDESLQARNAPAAATVAPAASTAQVRTGPDGRIPRLLRIQRLFESDVLPALRSRRDQVDLWDFDGDIVVIKASGPVVRDPDRMEALRQELETLLRERVAPDLRVQHAAQTPGSGR